MKKGTDNAAHAFIGQIGEGRLRSILIKSLGLSARETSETVIGSVRDWQAEASQRDDITLIVTKVK